MKRLNVVMDDELYLEFKAETARKGLSVSEVIRQAIEDHLKANGTAREQPATSQQAGSKPHRRRRR